MEVVSTSNLVFSENEKKKKTASNFKTRAMNSSVMPHDLMTDQIGSYAYMQI